MTPDPRAAYVAATIQTASPARLLVMLLDRLVLDARRGEEALHGGDHLEAHRQLTHAQDIVLELASSLRPDAFTGGRELAGVYDYLHRRLVTANIRKDASIAGECTRLCEDIAAMWREAALASLATA